jgi:hypothetical protein
MELNYFHLFSPITYMLFVSVIKNITPIPKSNTMKNLRTYHNIFLCFLSAIMFFGMIIANFIDNKYDSDYSFICHRYSNNNWIANYTTNAFLWSKYLEWGDTLFIHLSNRPITNLQYTHHMTTSLLAYLNVMDYISPSIHICLVLNAFVHIPMYWYFAYPKGKLFPYRVWITRIQIIQHIMVLYSTMYGYKWAIYDETCKQNKYGYEFANLLYLMYLVFFLNFYVKNYCLKTRKYVKE